MKYCKEDNFPNYVKFDPSMYLKYFPEDQKIIEKKF